MTSVSDFLSVCDPDKHKIHVMMEAFNEADKYSGYCVRLYSELIDCVIYQLESVLEKLEEQQEQQMFDHFEIFEEFKNEFRNSYDQFYNLYMPLEAYTRTCICLLKLCIHTFDADSYEHNINDGHMDKVNEMIAMHLYRQGMFDVADQFMNEAGAEELRDKLTDLGLRLQFKNLQDITDAVRNFETELPLKWIAENRERLGETKASELEYKIHASKYLHMVQESGARSDLKEEALNYARAHLNNMNERAMLYDCMIYDANQAGLVADSRYLHFFDGSYQQNLNGEIEEQYYIMMGQCVNDPLSTVTSVGAKFLSEICKAANTVVKDKNTSRWAMFKKLPLHVDLDEELKFHSQFTCPLLKSVKENPVASTCNHVIGLGTMHYIAHWSTTGSFPCTFCHTWVPKDGYKNVYFKKKNLEWRKEYRK